MFRAEHLNNSEIHTSIRILLPSFLLFKGGAPSFLGKHVACTHMRNSDQLFYKHMRYYFAVVIQLLLWENVLIY